MDIKISSPCSESWARMKGDDRVRYCMKCKLDVYNLDGMKPVEIEALVRRKSGTLCGRLYMRPERTASFQDCGMSRARRARRWAAAAAAFIVLAVFSWFLRATVNEPDRSMHPRWVRVVLDWISPESSGRGGAIMGKMMCPTPLPPPPPPPPTAP
jgi:hypothetical protein